MLYQESNALETLSLLENESISTNNEIRFLSPNVFSSTINKIKNNFAWLSIILSIARLPFYFLSISQAIGDTSANKATRNLRIAQGLKELLFSVVSTVIATLTIYITSPILIVIGGAKTFFENIVDIGMGIYNCFNQQGRHNKQQLNDMMRVMQNDLHNHVSISASKISKFKQLVNQQTHLNETIINKSHTLLQGTVALVGAALQLTPLAPIGMGLLIGVAIYGIADAIGVNPVAWLARGIHALCGYPFALKKETALLAQLNHSPASEKNRHSFVTIYQQLTGSLQVAKKVLQERQNQIHTTIDRHINSIEMQPISLTKCEKSSETVEVLQSMKPT